MPLSLPLASAAIFFNAGLCALAWHLNRNDRRIQYGWLTLWVSLTWVAIDEFCSIHENLVAPFRDSLQLEGLLYFAWVLPYGVAAMVLVAVLAPFLKRLPARARWTMVAAGTIYVVGAVGLEMVGGWVFEGLPNKRAPLWLVVSTFEEVLEMVGMTVFAYAVLDLLVRDYGLRTVQINFAPKESSKPLHAAGEPPF